jgi:hypothetical protein
MREGELAKHPKPSPRYRGAQESPPVSGEVFEMRDQRNVRPVQTQPVILQGYEPLPKVFGIQIRWPFGPFDLFRFVCDPGGLSATDIPSGASEKSLSVWVAMFYGIDPKGRHGV